MPPLVMRVSCTMILTSELSFLPRLPVIQNEPNGTHLTLRLVLSGCSSQLVIGLVLLSIIVVLSFIEWGRCLLPSLLFLTIT